MTLTPTLTQSAQTIIAELFADLKDLGLVDTFIFPSAHTSDFELPEGHKMRVLMNKNTFYYNVFREK